MTNKSKIILIIISVVLVVILIIAGVVGGTYISYSNQEIQIRNLIKAKIIDNQSEYDNMWKKIKQVAQVTEKDRESLMQIFVKHASARTSGGKDGALMKWIQESIPNVDNSMYKNLQSIIVASRDSWTMRQKELIDLKRTHDNLIMTLPGSLFLNSRGKIEIIVVTSSKTKETFKTGKDDDVDVFNN